MSKPERTSIPLYPQPKTVKEFDQVGKNITAKFGHEAAIGWHYAIQCYQYLQKHLESEVQS